MRVVFVGILAIAVTCLVAPVLSIAQTGALKNAIGMEFVKISAGEFMMGCSPDDNSCKNDEKPQHQVRITKAFEMGKYEVTQAQWKAMMMENQSAIVGDNNPVENVTRAEAIEFANRLNMRNDGYKYRLPTEAEWEYAARAGTKGATYGPLDEIAWYEKNSNDESHLIRSTSRTRMDLST
jgi:formylglycine-generating enzyme required for sulfatase activity